MPRPPCVTSTARPALLLSLLPVVSIACSTDAAPPETLSAAPLATCLHGQR